MQVNFYDYATTVNQVKEFGLVDPGDKEGKKPAFVSYDKSTDKWDGTAYKHNKLFGKELNKYENKRAYLCNSRRPFVPSIHKIAQQQFMQKNKIVLRIKTEIEELKWKKIKKLTNILRKTAILRSY